MYTYFKSKAVKKVMGAVSLFLVLSLIVPAPLVMRVYAEDVVVDAPALEVKEVEVTVAEEEKVEETKDVIVEEEKVEETASDSSTDETIEDVTDIKTEGTPAVLGVSDTTEEKVEEVISTTDSIVIPEEEICYADMVITSNGSELVDDGPATSVATWVHPGWTASIPGATWVWETFNIVDPTVDTTKLFTKYFVLPGVAQTATLKIATDNSYKVSINSNNDAYVDSGEFNFTAEGQDTYTGDIIDIGPADLVDYLNEGGNTFNFEVKNWGLADSNAESNPAGLLYELNIHYKKSSCDNDQDKYGYLTVNKVVIGGENEVKDFPLFVDEELVTSGMENEFSVGTHSISEDNLPGYTATFSGACTDQNKDGIAEVTIVEGNKHVCTITNTFEEEEEGGYCGDGIVNQNWEACDGGESCTQTCQAENQCSDKVFARVVVENVINDSPETGNVSDNIYLGGSENINILPNGTWFMIFDGTNYLTDTRTTGSGYFNVPGVAVQRTYTGGSSKLLTGIYGHDLGGATLEHVDGHIEFSNNISPVSVLNGPGSLGLENGFDNTGFGGTDHNNDEVRIDGYNSEFSLGTMAKGDAFYTVLSKAVSCDAGYCGDRVVNQGWEACDGGEGCTQTCQFEDQCTDKAFARIVVDNVINNSEDTGDVTSNVYLGGSENINILPNGTWFMIFDGTNYLTDTRTTGSGYFNVPGIAVQRLNNGGVPKILAGIYGHDLVGQTLEHVDGTLEFSGNTGAVALFDGPGSLALEAGFNGTGFGGTDHNDDEVRLNGDSAEFSLGTKVKGDAFAVSYSAPVACDDGDDEENICEANVNLMQNGSFEVDEVGSSWNIFDSGTISWLANWLNPIGAPVIAKIELQGNGLNGWTASDGDQWAELDSDWGYAENESGATEIYQDIPTVAGKTYTVSYAFSPRPGVVDNTLSASAEDVVKDTVSADGSALSNTDWENRSYTFTATDTSSKIAFKNTDTSDSLGTFLDNVTVVCNVDDGGNGGDGDDNDSDTGGGGGGGNGGGSNGGSSSNNESAGSVLGDSTAPGQVLGATLAQTGNSIASVLVMAGIVMLLAISVMRKKTLVLAEVK